MPGSAVKRQFILSAFDLDQWCPVLQARFLSDDLDALCSILGDPAKDDPELQNQYVLEPGKLAAIIEQFNVAFDPAAMACE